MPENIERGPVGELLSVGAPVIDVLPPQEHEELRLAGSVGLWLRQLDAESVASYSKTDPVVVYCHDYL